MPATLEKQEEFFTLDLSSCHGSEFGETLAKVQSVPGSRFNWDTKLWEIPPEARLIQRVIATMNPIADPAIIEWGEAQRKHLEHELVTRLPEDGKVLVPWGYDRTTWQPTEINEQIFAGLKPHQRSAVNNLPARAILADDQGLGKTGVILSFVAEQLVRYVNDYQLDRVHETVQEDSPTAHQEAKRGELSGPQGNHSSVDQRKEGSSLCGLWNAVAAAMHGSRSCEGHCSVLYRTLAVDSSTAWKIAGRDGPQRAGQVRGSMPELPPAEALARGPKLIVCPNSVKGVWQREIKRWLGEDAVITSGSTLRARKREIETGIEEGRWIVVNYEQLRIKKVVRDKRNGGKVTEWLLKEPVFEKTPWLVVVADEAHRIKNRKSLAARGLYRVQAPIMIAATGTPLMNSPGELWSLLHWLYPEQYKSYWAFHNSYVEETEGFRGKVVIGVKNPDGLRFELHKKMYRRTKDQVLDLPEKVRITVPITLDKKQQELYDEAERGLWLEVEKAIQEGDSAAKEFAERAGGSGSVNVYTIPNGAARTVRLRQVLSTPALLGGVDISAKLDAAVDAIVDNRHKPHVVFTEFVGTCEAIRHRLESSGLRVGIYTGETPQPVRTKLEDEFQNGDIDVMVGTIGAMREGITLTAADTVHFIERAWVPGWNEQAEDRLHRIGQTNNVTIYIYEGVDTVDENKVKPINRLKERIVSTVLPKDTIKEVQT